MSLSVLLLNCNFVKKILWAIIDFYEPCKLFFIKMRSMSCITLFYLKKYDYELGMRS